MRRTGQMPHAARTVTVTMTRQVDGSLVFASEQARGWRAHARSAHDLVRVVEQAFTEAECAAYARWKGEAYDADFGDDRPKRGTRRSRSDTHDPADWERLPDGRWRSPKGMAFRADTRVVQRVRARRRDMGLPY